MVRDLVNNSAAFKDRLELNFSGNVVTVCVHGDVRKPEFYCKTRVSRVTGTPVTGMFFKTITEWKNKCKLTISSNQCVVRAVLLCPAATLWWWQSGTGCAARHVSSVAACSLALAWQCLMK